MIVELGQGLTSGSIDHVEAVQARRAPLTRSRRPAGGTMIDDSGAGLRLSIDELRAQLEQELFYEDSRAAAECAYALAVRLRAAGRMDEARTSAGVCGELVERLPSATLDDVVPTRQAVGGVPMPDYFHEAVVRARLADLLGGA
jgi:hypothetical protein